MDIVVVPCALIRCNDCERAAIIQGTQPTTGAKLPREERLSVSVWGAPTDGTCQCTPSVQSRAYCNLPRIRFCRVAILTRYRTSPQGLPT